MIDPGHGGRDLGTIGGTGTLEKRIVLATALEIKRQLEAGGRCRVMMTRSRDVFISLAGRVGIGAAAEGPCSSPSMPTAPRARAAAASTPSPTPPSDALAARLAQRENDAGPGRRAAPALGLAGGAAHPDLADAAGNREGGARLARLA